MKKRKKKENQNLIELELSSVQVVWNLIGVMKKKYLQCETKRAAKDNEANCVQTLLAGNYRPPRLGALQAFLLYTFNTETVSVSTQFGSNANTVFVLVCQYYFPCAQPLNFTLYIFSRKFSLNFAFVIQKRSLLSNIAGITGFTKEAIK